MTTAEITDMREDAAKFFDLVENGEEIVLTQGGHTVATVKPESISAPQRVTPGSPEAFRLLAEFAEIRESQRARGEMTKTSEILAMIAAGRK